MDGHKQTFSEYQENKLYFLHTQTKTTCFHKPLVIDEHLSWKSHIDIICNKISKAIGIIHKSRRILSSKIKLLLYYSLIYPYIYYGYFIWSSTYPTNLNRFLLLQKRIVRIIANVDYHVHTKQLFHDFKILDIFYQNTLCIASFMFEYHHQLLPPCFNNLFLRNNQVHHYSTRNSQNYVPHFCRTNIKKFTVLYSGPQVWNSLPKDIINSISKTKLKSKLVTYLLSNKK